MNNDERMPKKLPRESGFFRNARNQRVMFLIFSVLVVLMTIMLAVIYISVPVLARKFFGNTESASSFVWPPIRVYDIYETRFTFNITGEMNLYSYVNTEIIFESPVYMQTNNTHVLQIDMPTLHLTTRPMYMAQEFNVTLVNPHIWEALGKRWLGRAFATNISPELKEPTWWLITTTVTIKALGMTWSGLQMERRQIWNGGLDTGIAPFQMRIEDWKPLFRNGFGIRLDLYTFSHSKVSIDFGTINFSIYSFFRTRNSSMVPVNLVKARLPNYRYGLGERNVTIENRIPISQDLVVRSYSQLLTNYLANRTSTVLVTDFKNRFGNRTVNWMSNSINSISLVINATRASPERTGKRLNTTFDYITDLGPELFHNITLLQ